MNITKVSSPRRGGYGIDKVCKNPACGKRFFIPSFSVKQYLYKRLTRTSFDYLCSYTCYRKLQLEDEAKIKAKPPSVEKKRAKKYMPYNGQSGGKNKNA